MKFLIIIIISITLINCSFDNRTGIWKNENPIQKKDQFEKFEKLSITEKSCTVLDLIDSAQAM